MAMRNHAATPLLRGSGRGLTGGAGRHAERAAPRSRRQASALQHARRRPAPPRWAAALHFLPRPRT